MLHYWNEEVLTPTSVALCGATVINSPCPGNITERCEDCKNMLFYVEQVSSYADDSMVQKYVELHREGLVKLRQDPELADHDAVFFHAAAHEYAAAMSDPAYTF